MTSFFKHSGSHCIEKMNKCTGQTHGRNNLNVCTHISVPLSRYYILIYLLTYSLALRSSKSLVPLFTDTRCSLSTAFRCHLLTFISRGPFSTSSSHISQGLPSFLPSGLLSNIFLTVLPWFILTKCPVQSNLFVFICAAMSRSLYNSLSSWLVLLLLNQGPGICPNAVHP